MLVHGRFERRACPNLSCGVVVAMLLGACGSDEVSSVSDSSSSEGTSSTGPSPKGTTASETADLDGGSTLEGTDSSGGDTGPVLGCGNGILEPGEQCDGEDLGQATCVNVLGYGGQLSCSAACTFDIIDCFPPGMTLIPGGSFEMGSDAYADDERPARKVKLDPFFIDTTEVTVADYAACAQAFECTLPAQGFNCNWAVPGRDDHPINCVSWMQAEAYCGWVGGMHPKRLPTEAEWEKAARGDDARLYPWGDEPAPSCTHVIMYPDGIGGGCGQFSSYPVGSRPLGSSPYGVHDMAGNVWNWVADWYGVYDVFESENPLGPPSGQYRIIRGGGWATSDINWFRASARNPSYSNGNANIGFRCAQDPLVTQ